VSGTIATLSISASVDSSPSSTNGALVVANTRDWLRVAVSTQSGPRVTELFGPVQGWSMSVMSPVGVV
jgi:hypothetical protein